MNRFCMIESITKSVAGWDKRRWYYRARIGLFGIRKVKILKLESQCAKVINNSESQSE